MGLLCLAKGFFLFAQRLLPVFTNVFITKSWLYQWHMCFTIRRGLCTELLTRCVMYHYLNYNPNYSPKQPMSLLYIIEHYWPNRRCTQNLHNLATEFVVAMALTNTRGLCTGPLSIRLAHTWCITIQGVTKVTAVGGHGTNRCSSNADLTIGRYTQTSTVNGYEKYKM